MTAEIIQLGDLDEEDKDFNEFLDHLKNGNSRAVFIVEKEDGTIVVGTTSQEVKDIVYDIFRLQELCRKFVIEG